MQKGLPKAGVTFNSSKQKFNNLVKRKKSGQAVRAKLICNIRHHPHFLFSLYIFV